jgi:hypothetical protein
MSNRTKTFAQFLTAYQRFTGTETMDATNTAVATLAFARNMKRGWEAYDWPWATVVEERTPDVNNLIAYAQSGESRIAEVLEVYSADPQGTAGFYPLTYTLNGDGILFGGSNIPDSAWVYFRKDCPDYYGDAYNGATAYAVGDQVYYATTGDFYVAIASTTGNAPTDATKWTRLTVPWDLFDYALYRSAADLLTTNGQNPPTGRASTLYGEAQEELFNQIEKYSRQQSFRPQRQVFYTHGTQQLRN